MQQTPEHKKPTRAGDNPSELGTKHHGTQLPHTIQNNNHYRSLTATSRTLHHTRIPPGKGEPDREEEDTVAMAACAPTRPGIEPIPPGRRTLHQNHPQGRSRGRAIRSLWPAPPSGVAKGSGGVVVDLAGTRLQTGSTIRILFASDKLGSSEQNPQGR